LRKSPPIHSTSIGSRFNPPPNTPTTQYKYGGTLGDTIGKLYQEGGVGRFYQGLSVAALQLPLSRFGDVAANAFVLALLDSLDSTRDLPIPLKTALGSVSAGLWRLLLMPLDAVKVASG
jgi:hypothetical protein